MFNSGYIDRRSRLRFCVLVSVVLTSCASPFAVRLQVQQPADEPRPPKQGVRVIKVVPGGQADRAGIQDMDLLSKYGPFTVTDYSTYYKAREAYLKEPNTRVELEIWRGRTRLTMQVFPGMLGMDTNEYNPVAYQLDAVLKSLAIRQQIPDYQREVEFKDAFQQESLDQEIAKAKAMIDDAEAQGTLTPAQILVARISIILNDAAEEDLKKQDALLAEFISNQPAEYIGYLGERFRESELWRPAKVLLKNYLMTDADNVSVRLNLGYVNTKLGLWSEVEAGADLVLSNPEDLSEYGLFVAYQQKAHGALNRGDYNTTIDFAQRAFALEPETNELALIQLAAAATGDIAKFNEASRTYKEVLPKMYEQNKLQIDAVEALTLAKNGQDALARAVVARWKQKDRVEGRLRHYWGKCPGGAKVIDNWSRLSAN